MDKNELFIGEKKIRALGFFGLGISNAALSKFIKKNYPEVQLTLYSDAPTTAVDASLFDAIYKGGALIGAKEDAVMLSPSVRRDRPEVLSAKSRGVLISSETEFFFERYGGDGFAISGSDGKSTTTALTALLLKERYSDAMALGNIGKPLTEGIETSAAAIELSSFQLTDTVPKLKRATVTNITPNHLNWHKDYREYREAKENLYRAARERVFNCDCPEVKGFIKKYDAFALYSIRSSEEALKSLSKAEVYLTVSDGYIIANGERLLSLSRLKLCGEHNIKNMMAAIALTFGLVSRAHVEEVAESFGGLRHRNELIGSYLGVSYYNSSIDSSPARTVTTVRSHREPLTLILGGRSKGLDYAPLAPIIEKRVGAVIITGENRGEILKALSTVSGVNIHEADTLADAVHLARKITEPGASVLLSPASTSFDAFRNFEERGEVFTNIVKEIFSK